MSQINPSNLSYRPDIDGLRALAVLSVVLFHAFPEWVHGGFIGVDIFFVISGYLISSIILKDLENQTFSFSNFYIRRIKRIFPALITVLISCLIFGWYFLLADEYKELGKHAFGASTFTNNFMLWQESGYFDNQSESKPLLHLWSLSVEEQFYLLWPLFLWIAFKWKKYLSIILSLFAFGFTFLHFYIFYPDRIASFYAPQARFFELLIGACIAFRHIKMGGLSLGKVSKFRSIQSWVGLALILIGIQITTKQSHFPGWFALFSPVLGTAMIIDNQKDSWLNKYFFSKKIIVWIGLISFPLYLWHWPLISFAFIIESQTPSLYIRMGLVILAFILATLTYYFIETPIRFSRNQSLENKTIGLIICIIIIGTIGGIIYLKNGLKQRPSANPIIQNEGDISHTIFHKYMDQHFYLCTPLNIREKALTWDGIIRCSQSKQNLPIDIAIVGDSHAEQMFIGLAEALPNKNVVFYEQDTLPLISNQQFDHIFKYLMSDEHIKTVILNANWDIRKKELRKKSNLYNELFNTIEELSNSKKNIIITNDIPTFSFLPQQCKYLRPLSFKNNCLENKNFFLRKYLKFSETFRKLEQNKKVKVLDTLKLFKDGDNFFMGRNGHVFYRDNQHLNILGSRYLGQEVLKLAPELKK